MEMRDNNESAGAKKSPPPAPQASGADMKSARTAVGVNVMVSIVAAGALLVLLNVISGLYYFRRDMESLGRYSLSLTAKKVLDQVNQPIHFTTIYTSADKDKDPEKYFPRVRDLLEAMAQHKQGATVEYATSDRDKARVLQRMRERVSKAAEKHRSVINEFRALAQRQAAEYKKLAAEWEIYPRMGWLGQFGTPKVMENALNQIEKELRKSDRTLGEELSRPGVPDYPAMVQQVTDMLDQLNDGLSGIAEGLRELSRLPEQAAKAGPGLTQAAKGVTDALSAGIAALGKVGSPVPDNPADMLKKLAADLSAVAAAAQTAVREVNAFSAGSLARAAEAWRTERGSIPVLYVQLAQSASGLADQTQSILMATKPEVQRSVIAEFRANLPGLAETAARAQAAVEKLLAGLVKLDDETRNIFAEAKKDDYLQDLLKPIGELLARAKDLGPLEGQEDLIRNIKEDNVVLVQIGEKTSVVPFEEVWPPAPDLPWTRPDEEGTRRAFYGDMAIRGRILSTATKPFAEVVLTFFEQLAPPQLRGQMPSTVGPIPSVALSTLRDRLEKANCVVTEWNLAKGDEEPPAAEPGRPQVLLVLPPPDPTPPFMREQMPMPQFGPEQVAKIGKVIAAGTPALFLAGYLAPTGWMQSASPAYGLGDYLREEWGVDVRTDSRVVLGEADPDQPGSYQIPVMTWKYLPLADFTDHPVGQPLQARRMYWLEVCPIALADGGKGKEGVAVRDILRVPRQSSDTLVWATRDVEQLIRRVIGEKPISPNPQQDVLAPFSVAVEAHAGQGPGARRIIVLGLGFSFLEDYLNYPVQRLKGKTVATDPPPIGNVDLVTNCVYRLVGKDEFIGAGPPLIKPIGLISPAAMSALKTAFGFLWPVAVIVLGGAVVMIRRK